MPNPIGKGNLHIKIRPLSFLGAEKIVFPPKSGRRTDTSSYRVNFATNMDKKIHKSEEFQIRRKKNLQLKSDCKYNINKRDEEKFST